MRLIDADLALEKIRVLEKEPDYQHEDEDWSVGLCMAEQAIDEVPTIKGYCNAEEIYNELLDYGYPSAFGGWAVSMDSVRRVLRKYLDKEGIHE